MLSTLKELLFGKPPIEKHHEFFGKMLFMGGDKPEPNDYWENEQLVDGVKEPLSVLITAGLDGPTSNQVRFYKECISDLDELFTKCWPIFEPDFEEWTEKKFTGKWQDDFELMSIEIPRNGDVSNEWTVSYYVDAAKHYFTARFIDGKPMYNEIDG